jgi:hypothetical protein
MSMTCFTPIGRGMVLGNHLLLLMWERIGKKSGFAFPFNDFYNIMMGGILHVIMISTNQTRIFGFTLGFILSSGFRIFFFFLLMGRILRFSFIIPLSSRRLGLFGL